jgi:hypothetical protein
MARGPKTTAVVLLGRGVRRCGAQCGGAGLDKPRSCERTSCLWPTPNLRPANIQGSVKVRLAAHEYPWAVEFVAELPMTATGNPPSWSFCGSPSPNRTRGTCRLLRRVK